MQHQPGVAQAQLELESALMHADHEYLKHISGCVRSMKAARGRNVFSFLELCTDSCNMGPCTMMQHEVMVVDGCNGTLEFVTLCIQMPAQCELRAIHWLRWRPAVRLRPR